MRNVGLGTVLVVADAFDASEDVDSDFELRLLLLLLLVCIPETWIRQPLLFSTSARGKISKWTAAASYKHTFSFHIYLSHVYGDHLYCSKAHLVLMLQMK